MTVAELLSYQNKISVSYEIKFYLLGKPSKKKRQKKLNFFNLGLTPPPITQKVKNSLFKLDLL